MPTQGEILDLLYGQPVEIQLWASSKNIVTMFMNINRQKWMGTMKITGKFKQAILSLFYGCCIA